MPPLQIIGPVQQHVHLALRPERAFGAQPVVERGRVVDGEPLAELAARERGRRGPVAGPRELVELVNVQADRVRPEPHLPGGRLEPFVAEDVSQCANRFAERVPGRGFGLVGPEQPDQVLAAPDAAGRTGEVEQQAEVLSPEKLGRRRRTVHLDRDGAEGANMDHGWKNVSVDGGATL